MLDCQLYGLKSGAHHLTSVLLHACNAVLVFLVFRRMTGAFWRCVVLAALFALHPLQVDSVAWVAERKNLLSAFFWLLATGAYVGYGQRKSRAGAVSPVDARRSTLYYVLALVFFASWPDVQTGFGHLSLCALAPGLLAAPASATVDAHLSAGGSLPRLTPWAPKRQLLDTNRRLTSERRQLQTPERPIIQEQEHKGEGYQNRFAHQAKRQKRQGPTRSRGSSVEHPRDSRLRPVTSTGHTPRKPRLPTTRKRRSAGSCVPLPTPRSACSGCSANNAASATHRQKAPVVLRKTKNTRTHCTRGAARSIGMVGPRPSPYNWQSNM